MNTQPESYFEATPEEIAAVEEGKADFAAGRVLTEEQFHEAVNEMILRRQAEVDALLQSSKN